MLKGGPVQISTCAGIPYVIGLMNSALGQGMMNYCHRMTVGCIINLSMGMCHDTEIRHPRQRGGNLARAIALFERLSETNQV